MARGYYPRPISFRRPQYGPHRRSLYQRINNRMSNSRAPPGVRMGFAAMHARHFARPVFAEAARRGRFRKVNRFFKNRLKRQYVSKYAYRRKYPKEIARKINSYL